MKDILRFWRSVDKDAPGGCWLWTGHVDPHGNAQFRAQSRSISARRLAWDLEHPDHDPLHPGVKVYASCGTKHCINPAHTAVRVGGGNNPGEVCGRGHPFTDENIYITTQGKRACRQCIRDNSVARRLRYLKEGRGWGKNYRPLSGQRKIA